MKDAKGHGSEGRGVGAASTIKSGGLRGVGLAFGATMPSDRMKPDRDYKNDAERTVADLRGRMTGTGPGHQAGLLQGIKNFFGG